MSELRVGLLGLGIVNSAVARYLLEAGEHLATQAQRRIVIGGIAVRDTRRARDVDLGDIVVTDDADALVRAESIDVVVEAIGGVEPARGLIAAALTSGKSVVTANKAVMAAHGAELGGIAVAHGCVLLHSASVGGGTPMLELLDSALRGDSISAVEAVCNGTTNYILGRMSDAGASFADALADAQLQGFAEADPTSDVDGWDAAFKLSLIVNHAWAGRVDAATVRRRGIRSVTAADMARAADLGYAIKLVASARRIGATIAVAVQPTLLAHASHPLARVDGSANGLLVTGRLSAATFVAGTGAGGDATASALINDIVSVARGAGGWRPKSSMELTDADTETAETAAYIRVVGATPGAADEVVQMLEDRGVAVDAVVEGDPGEIIVLTRVAPVAVIERSIETLESMAAVERVAAHFDLAIT